MRSNRMGKSLFGRGGSNSCMIQLLWPKWMVKVLLWDKRSWGKPNNKWQKSGLASPGLLTCFSHFQNDHLKRTSKNLRSSRKKEKKETWIPCLSLLNPSADSPSLIIFERGKIPQGEKKINSYINDLKWLEQLGFQIGKGFSNDSGPQTFCLGERYWLE